MEEDESQNYWHNVVVHSAESLEVLEVAANEELGHDDQKHQVMLRVMALKSTTMFKFGMSSLINTFKLHLSYVT